MNQCFQFALMLLDRWINLSIWIDVSLHPYWKVTGNRKREREKGCEMQQRATGWFEFLTQLQYVRCDLYQLSYMGSLIIAALKSQKRSQNIEICSSFRQQADPRHVDFCFRRCETVLHRVLARVQSRPSCHTGADKKRRGRCLSRSEE